MSKSDSERIILALDGIAAQVETLRGLVSDMMEKTEPVESGCTHSNIREVRTMGGIVGAFCEDCDKEFSMGVSTNPILDK